MKYKHHPESRKRVGRVRIGQSIISMPHDLKTRLDQQADLSRTDRRSCMYLAVDYGLTVIEILHGQAGTIVNMVANKQSQSDTQGEAR